MSQRWPLHPPPSPHESLSSWLERLASCYGYRSEDVLRYDLGFPALSSEQLDINPPPLFLERLAERSGFSVERLRALTIQGWVPQLIDSLKPDAESYPKYVREYALLYPTESREYQVFQDWVPWMSAHRMGGKAACRFCLREDPEPYRRLFWQMAWMNRCPIHGILLEEIVVVAGQVPSAVVEEPVPAEILTLDGFTRQAIEKGMVFLPYNLVSGGTWLRILRTVLDELTLPAAPLKQYSPAIATIWGNLGLGVRQGMRRATIPFEQLDQERQFLLMRVAGVAVELLMKGRFKQVGKDAFLFRVSSGNHEKQLVLPLPLLPEQTSAPLSGEGSSYEQAWGKAHTAMEEVARAMCQDLQTAIQMRQILLGPHPTPKRIEEIDRLFREQGYLLPDDVIE